MKNGSGGHFELPVIAAIKTSTREQTLLQLHRCVKGNRRSFAMARIKQHIVLGTDKDDFIDGNWPHRSEANGAEIILGLKGSDAIYGLGGNDFIDAGLGNDTVDGGAGNDTYTGGGGSDRYVYNPGDGLDTLIETKNQDGVLDSVLFSGTMVDFDWSFDGSDLLVGPGVGPFGILDPANYVRIVGQYSSAGGGIEYFEGDIFEDNGSYTDQSVVPGALARIYTPSGPTGHDQGPYTELIHGTDGNDTLIGGGGFSDQFFGGSGNDLVQGSDVTTDVMLGGGGNDTLLGFGGNDRFRGQQGDDLIDGGAGDDRVQYSGYGGTDTGSTDAVHVDLRLQGVPQFISVDQGWDTLVSIEQVRGSVFNDTLIGDDGSNFINGGLSAPFADGDDLIIGNGGDDNLSGSDGNDTLIGGAGTDNLSGNAGSDVFKYTDIGDGVFDVDSLNDLQVGAGGDIIDIQDLLVGFDPGNSNVTDFVNVIDNFDGAGNSLLQADPDGKSGPAGFTDLAVLVGITSLSAQDLYDGGNLLVSGASA
jgi:Ca2+-binding RTX toxin-like protein